MLHLVIQNFPNIKNLSKFIFLGYQNIRKQEDCSAVPESELMNEEVRKAHKSNNRSR